MTAPSVLATIASSSWVAPSRPSAIAQSIVSATPGGLYRLSSRSASTAPATWRASSVVDVGHAQLDDRDLALEVGMLDPVVEAPALQGVVDVAGAVRGEHHERRPARPVQADLGDGDLVVGEHLEQVGLELVVGAVDLVDQQHRRRPLDRLDRPEQGPLDQESFAVELGLEVVGRPRGGLAGRLGGTQVEQLAGVVPVVDGLGDVDALVALQADQFAAGHRRERLGEFGLADAGLALEEQRPLQRDRQEHRGGDALVGQVPLAGERCRDVGRGRDGRLRSCGDDIQGAAHQVDEVVVVERVAGAMSVSASDASKRSIGRRPPSTWG